MFKKKENLLIRTVYSCNFFFFFVMCTLYTWHNKKKDTWLPKGGIIIGDHRGALLDLKEIQIIAFKKLI